MRNLCVLLVVCASISLFSLSALAEGGQSFSIKGGLNFADFSEYSDETDVSASMSEISEIGTEDLIGFAAGVSLRLPLGEMIALQPELFYSQKGTKTEPFESGGVTVESKLIMNYIDVPVLLVFSPTPVFDIFGGGYVDYYLDGEMEMESGDLSATMDIESDGITKPGYGAVVGGTFHFGSLHVDARYYHGLSDVLDPEDVDDFAKYAADSDEDDYFDFQHRVIQLLVGFTL